MILLRTFNIQHSTFNVERPTTVGGAHPGIAPENAPIRSAAVSLRLAAAGTNVARSMDLTCASFLAKPLRLIPRGARHSRAPGRCADAPLEFSYSFCAFASWRLCVKSGRVG
jgi:hypothetical protein